MPYNPISSWFKNPNPENDSNCFRKTTGFYPIRQMTQQQFDPGNCLWYGHVWRMRAILMGIQSRRLTSRKEMRGFFLMGYSEISALSKSIMLLH